MKNVKITRVTTVDGNNVLISAGAIKLHRIIGEEASTTVVTLKNNAASPATVAALAAGAIPLAGGVSFEGVDFPLGMNIAIAATGKNLLVVWSPL